MPFAYTPSPGAFPPPVPTAGQGAAERRALSFIQIAAILTLVGFVVDLAIGSLLNISSFYTIAYSGTRPTITLSLPSPWVWIPPLVVGPALGIAAVALFRGAFTGLRAVDSRFKTPAALAFVAIIGIALILPGAGLLLDALYGAAACAGSGQPITVACIVTPALGLGITLVLAGAIMALVGFIGILVGIWRLGTRYGDSLFKAGAILLILPYADVIGAILVLLASSKARGQTP